MVVRAALTMAYSSGQAEDQMALGSATHAPMLGWWCKMRCRTSPTRVQSLACSIVLGSAAEQNQPRRRSSPRFSAGDLLCFCLWIYFAIPDFDLRQARGTNIGNGHLCPCNRSFDTIRPHRVGAPQNLVQDAQAASVSAEALARHAVAIAIQAGNAALIVVTGLGAGGHLAASRLGATDTEAAVGLIRRRA